MFLPIALVGLFAGLPVNVADEALNLPAPVMVECAVTADMPQWQALRITLAPEVHAHLVAWTESDNIRLSVDLDEELRLQSLLLQGSEAARHIRWGEGQARFVAEYFSAEKRGNPRRTILEATEVAPGVVRIDFAA